jgi:hypothetical protein
VGTIGFAGTAPRARGGEVTAAGLTELGGEGPDDRPTTPMLPGNWQPADAPPEHPNHTDHHRE